MSCNTCRRCLAPLPTETKMSAEARSVHTDALATLGTIIDETAGRDAIHLAVEPVIAGEDLYPGQHIRIAYGVAVSNGEAFGIVDPFLKGLVRKGSRFWFVIYPRQITSLRHVWEHPAFAAMEVTAVSQSVASKTPDSKNASIEWMKRWADEHMGDDYYGAGDEKRSVESSYASAIEAGHNNHIGPYEDARDHIDDVWWDHWENITGEKGERGSYFSCGC